VHSFHRTEKEVTSAKGFGTCGNKHCPCYFVNSAKKKTTEEVVQWKAIPSNNRILDEYSVSCENANEESNEESELQRLEHVPSGLGLYDYEVHFAYVEQGANKEELVKLKLCLRCAPKLFYGKGDALGARMARDRNREEEDRHQTKSVSMQSKLPEIGSGSSDNESFFSHEGRKRRRRNKREVTEAKRKQYRKVGSPS